MTLERDLAPGLEQALAHLPPVPASSYLTAARKVRRRRRIVGGSVAAAVLAGGVVLGAPLLDSPDRPPVASGGPTQGGSLDPIPVTGPGLEGVDAFTTEGIPAWAQEHGSHPPAYIAPDGRLWIAPGAVVQRTIVDPLERTGEGDTPESYAVEVRFEGETRWGFLPVTWDWRGSWTNDFELWVEDRAAQQEGRPSFGERLVQFAGPNSDTLVGGEGVTLVRQRGVTLPANLEQYPRSVVAEVRFEGRTWFVLAWGPKSNPWYDAYERAVSAPDLERFVTWLDAPHDRK